MEKQPKDYLTLALDVDTMDEARELVRELKDYVSEFKVGLQLYTSVGPDVFKMINDEGSKVFFDGKFHDIPNTVYKAMKNLAKLGVDMTNLHAAGTIEMMKAAKELDFERAAELRDAIIKIKGQD